MTRAIFVLAALACLALAPAANAATPFQLGKGSHPDVAVDGSGTAHIVVDLPDNEDLRYCQIPRGQTSCSVELILDPPAASVGRSSYVFLPAPGRVVIATHRCCSPDATFAYQSNDNGASFSGPVAIGNIDFKGNAVFGPGEAVSGIDNGGRYQRMPLSGPQETKQAMLDAGFPIPTHSSMALLGGTTPVKVTGDGDNTTFHRQNGAGDPNDASTWTGPTPLSPPGTEMHLASGSAGLAMIYRTGSPGQLHARKFDGSSFGPATTLSTGDPIQTDLNTDSSGRFTAGWIENDINPNEFRVRQSADGVNWDFMSVVLRGENVDGLFNTQVATAPDGQGFAVFDSNSSSGNITVTPLEAEPTLGPGGESPVLGSTTVADQEITFFGPGPCVQPPEKVTLRVTSKRKKKLAPRRQRAKISIVVFSVDKTKKTDKKSAFKQNFSTANFPRGSFHNVRAVVTLKPVVKGAFKAKKKTLKGRFNVCG